MNQEGRPESAPSERGEEARGQSPQTGQMSGSGAAGATGGGRSEVDVVWVLVPETPPREVEVRDLSVQPVDFVGQAVRGQARVDEVVSDRGFYIGQKPNRLFVVFSEDAAKHSMVDISAGERVIFEGLLLSKGAADDLKGDLEPKTRRALEQARAFVALSPENIRVLPSEEGGGQGGSRAREGSGRSSLR